MHTFLENRHVFCTKEQVKIELKKHYWGSSLANKSNQSKRRDSRALHLSLLFLFLCAYVCASASAFAPALDMDNGKRAIEQVESVVDNDTQATQAGSAEPQTIGEAVQEEQEWKKPVFAIKNNLLYDAVLTPNLTFEARLAERWTLQAEVGFNPFPLNDEVEHKWRHILVGLEAKYWFSRAFRCDFIGINAYYSHFNVAKGWYPVGWLYPDVKKYRVQGDMVAAGVSYGWFFPLSKHVGIELEAGVDAGYAWFDRFNCAHCGAMVDSPRRWFAMPKAGVNIAIVIPNNDDDDCPCRRQHEELEELAVKDTALVVDSIGPIGPIIPISQPEEPSEPEVEPEPVPVPVLSAPERLNSPILHSFSEYRPYSPDVALSKDSDALYIYFAKDTSTIHREFGINGLILDSIIHIVSELRKDSLSEMKMIQIVGFASFDGPIKRNKALAGNRAQALKDYIQEHVDVPDSLFEVNNGGEAWAELEWAVEQSDYAQKDKVLRIIREEPSPSKREVRLKELDHGRAYAYLRDQLLAKYRNAGYIRVYYDVPKSSAATE